MHKVLFFFFFPWKKGGLWKKKNRIDLLFSLPFKLLARNQLLDRYYAVTESLKTLAGRGKMFSCFNQDRCTFVYLK